MRKSVSFESVRELYQSFSIDKSSSEVQLGLKLYQCWITSSSSPIYVIDTKNIIHSKKHVFPISPINGSDVDALIPPEERVFIIKQTEDPRIKNWQDMKKYMYQTEYTLMEEELSQFVRFNQDKLEIKNEWDNLVSEVVSFNSQKDPRVFLAQKAVITRGFIMQYQPHSIWFTNPNIGKTAFLQQVSRRFDKITRNVLLGSARWVNDKAIGLLHNQYYPFAIEQIESQNIDNLLGFLLTYMESGESRISGGGVEMIVKGACPIIVTGNPYASFSSSNPFGVFLSYLSRNTYALGRRFGIILYGKYDEVKALGYDEFKHSEYVNIFRAFEEISVPELHKIWKHPKIIEFCSQKVYEPEIGKLIEKCTSIEVQSFLLSHYHHGYPHIRGGAINLAITDLMPLIAVNSVLSAIPLNELIEKIIEKASYYVKKLVEINKESIENIIKQ